MQFLLILIIIINPKLKDPKFSIPEQMMKNPQQLKDKCFYLSGENTIMLNNIRRIELELNLKIKEPRQGQRTTQMINKLFDLFSLNRNQPLIISKIYEKNAQKIPIKPPKYTN